MKKYVWYQADDEEDSLWETEDNEFPGRNRWVRWSDVGPVFDAAMAVYHNFRDSPKDGKLDPILFDKLMRECRHAEEK